MGGGSARAGVILGGAADTLAWGDNDWFKLGNGLLPVDNVPVPVPLPVSGLPSRPVEVAAGYTFSMALMADGTAWSWGGNSWGELGTGSDAYDVRSPGQVRLDHIRQIGAGVSSGLALREDGTVWTWGNNQAGQLGNGIGPKTEPVYSNVPVQVPGLAGITAIAAGGVFNLALSQDGVVWAWGDNRWGEAGIGTPTIQWECACEYAPVRVTGLSGVAAIAAGIINSAVLRADGTVWTWGNNQDGELGAGFTTVSGCECVASPVQVAGLNQVRYLGQGATMAIRADGTLWAWGYGGNGSLGDPAYESTPCRCSAAPVPVSGLAGVVAAAESDGGYAVEADGSLWDWGRNDYGQLGRPDTNPNPADPYRRDATPTQVSGIAHATAVAAGFWDALVATAPPVG
ncbi:MAG: RCC1 domain-containing protein [Candidatus Dormibacteria bacterium]